MISLACLADSVFRDVSSLSVSTSVSMAHHLARFVELGVIRWLLTVAGAASAL